MESESEEALEIARNLPSIMPDYGPVLQARIHNCYEKYALAYQQNLKDCGTKLRQTELEKRRCSYTTNINNKLSIAAIYLIQNLGRSAQTS